MESTGPSEPISSIDLKLKKIKNQTLKSKVRLDCIIEKINMVLERDYISDDILYKINKSFNIYGYSFTEVISPLFSKLVDISIREEHDLGSIRESVTNLMITIISREDFNCFADDVTFEAFVRLLTLKNSKDINIVSIISYLINNHNLNKQVYEAASISSIDTVIKRVYKFCYCFDDGESVFEYKKNKFN